MCVCVKEEGVCVKGGGRMYEGRKGIRALYTRTSIFFRHSCVTKYTIMTNRTTHSNFTCTLVAPPECVEGRLSEIEGGGSVCEGKRESVRVTCGSREERVCEK